MLTEAHARGPNEPEVRDITLGGLLEWAAATTPDRIALIEGRPEREQRRQWTYAELYREAQRTAKALRARFEPGERVAIWAQNLPEWIMIEFGAAMAGVILVTVNPGLRASEVEYILNQSRSAGLLVAREFRGTRMRDTALELAPKCKELREIICFDDWNEFLVSGDRADPQLPDVKSTDAVMIQYTSGTTGFPKGALLHHRGLVNNGAHTNDRCRIDRRQRAGDDDAAVPHRRLRLLRDRCSVEAHDAGTGRSVRSGPRDPAGAGVSHQRHARRADHADRRAWSILRFSTADLSSLQVIYSGGSTVPAAVVTALEQKLSVLFAIVFGMTECSPVCLMTWTTDTLRDKSETLGTAMPNTEIRIVDPDGKTAALGEKGEICTRGYHVMKGYFENAGRDGGCDRRGRLAAHRRPRRDGRARLLQHRGSHQGHDHPRRREHLSEGARGTAVPPSERRRCRRGRPARREVGRGGRRRSFVPRQATRSTAKSCSTTCASISPRTRRRRHWFAVEAMPLTGSGKIQKFKLREQWKNGEFKEL